MFVTCFNRKGYVLRSVSFFLVLAVLGSMICLDIVKSREFDTKVYGLPLPNRILKLSGGFSDPVLKGLFFDQKTPGEIEFIIDSSDKEKVSPKEIYKLASYFFAALTVPSEDLWVNLSPHEHDRITPDGLSKTQLGKDLLGQDYILKQLSSSLTHPDTSLGRTYWRMENGKSALSKIWIVPKIAKIFENDKGVLIAESTLDIKTESLGMNVLFEPLCKEINQGKNFSELRQMYSAIILARWFKTRFYESVYNGYIAKNKTNGIELDDKNVRQKIWKLYCKSFERGVYDMIRPVSSFESPNYKKSVKQFFAGGCVFVDFKIQKTTQDLAFDAVASAEGNLSSALIDTLLAESLGANLICLNLIYL